MDGIKISQTIFERGQPRNIPVKLFYNRAMIALDCSPESFSPQMNSTFFVPFVPNYDPQGGASFDPKGHHMNKIDKGLQGDATYQLSKLYPFQFQRPQRNHMNKTD